MVFGISRKTHYTRGIPDAQAVHANHPEINIVLAQLIHVVYMFEHA